MADSTKKETKSIEDLELDFHALNPFIMGKPNPEMQSLIEDALSAINDMPYSRANSKLQMNWKKRQAKFLKKSKDPWNEDMDMFLDAVQKDAELSNALNEKLEKVMSGDLENVPNDVELIFLDVDGVLNHGTGGPRRAMLETLGKALNERRRIVISSSWRRGENFVKWLLWSFREVIGNWDMFIAVTPILETNRDDEILEFLKDFQIQVQSFVILDDLNFTDEELFKRLVHTKVDVGLTSEHLNDIERILSLTSSQDG